MKNIKANIALKSNFYFEQNPIYTVYYQICGRDIKIMLDLESALAPTLDSFFILMYNHGRD